MDVKYNNGKLIITMDVTKEGFVSASGKSLVFGGGSERDVNIGISETVRVSASVYLPLATGKAKKDKAPRETMSVADARKMFKLAQG